jgi:hypothetical protein
LWERLPATIIAAGSRSHISEIHAPRKISP